MNTITAQLKKLKIYEPLSFKQTWEKEMASVETTLGIKLTDDDINILKERERIVQFRCISFELGMIDSIKTKVHKLWNEG
jgi:hypothetical protein